MQETQAMKRANPLGQAMREAMKQALARYMSEEIKARRVGGGAVPLGPGLTRRVRHEVLTLGRLGWGTRLRLWIARRVLA